jgi:hypothetical protein
MFRPEELRAMLSVADPTSKVALLLEINCAMGPADIARLPMTAVDIETAWLLFPRGKTVGEESRDPAAVQAIMGHVAG